MSDDTEAFYDTEIAPKLLRLGRLCENRGVPFLAAVSLPDGLATTAAYPAIAPIEFRMLIMAGESDGNADALIMKIMRHAEKHGHASALLMTLGVPMAPESDGAGS